MRPHEVEMVKELLTDFLQINDERVCLEARTNLNREDRDMLRRLQNITDNVASGFVVLPEQERKLVYLFYFRNMQLGEAAKILHITLSTAQNLIRFVHQKYWSICLLVFPDVEKWWTYKDKKVEKVLKKYIGVTDDAYDC